MTDHSPDPSDAYERPEVFDLTPNAMTATQPWETDSSALALTAASLLNELRPLVAAALDWDDACRHSPGSTLADVTATRNALASSLDALSEDAHVWARGESLVDDAPPTFAVGPAPESVFDSEDGDQLGAACCGSGFLVHPGDRAVAFALVADDLARHLMLQLEGRNSMPDDAEAREALSAFYMVRAAMIREATS